ncbi:hypothetical protein HDU79_004690 [Rhizoclosmatium sp. JEL0117]|nr:hypothetical protein HDU79_004690 [Rhizoclosmatium sp. JEL0117]
MATVSEPSFPIATQHQSQIDVCGIPTDIVVTHFANEKVFVIVSQCGNIGGTIVEAKHDRSENKHNDAAAQGAFATTATLKTLLGARNDPLVHVYATHLLDVVSKDVGTELVLSLALKSYTDDDYAKEGERLRAIASIVKDLASSK